MPKHQHQTHPQKAISIPLTTEQALKAALQVKLEDVKALEKKSKNKKG